MFPAVEAGATFLTTRMVRLDQTICTPECLDLCTSECFYANTSWEYFYVADPEMFTLRVDHTVNVPDFRLSQTTEQMTGKMLDWNGTEVDPCDGAWFPSCDVLLARAAPTVCPCRPCSGPCCSGSGAFVQRTTHSGRNALATFTSAPGMQQSQTRWL